LWPEFLIQCPVPRYGGRLVQGALVWAALSANTGFSQQAAVRVSFDHVATPVLSRRDSDPALLWLRLRNNGREPIQVLATVPEGGAEGVELVHEIVEAGNAKPTSGWISRPARYSPVNEATTVEILPGKDLLFSVPLNHVGPSWRLRLNFQSGPQRQGSVDFNWAEVPVKQRSAWKSDSRK
jgi:hypothetical protein